MKRFGVILLLLMSFMLVSCKPDEIEEDLRDPIEIGLAKFSENNYELKVDVFYYNELQQTIIIRVDDNKSQFVFDENNIDYYVREDDNLTSYLKDGNSYKVVTEQQPQNKDILLFNNLDKEWFNFNEDNSRFNLKADNLEDFSNILDLSEEFVVKSAYFKLNDQSYVDFLRVNLDHLGYNYYYEFNVSSYGEVTIELPSGGIEQ